MREAVIVSTARTLVGMAYRDAFSNTRAQALGGYAVAKAVKRAWIDPAEIGDVTMCVGGCMGAAGLFEIY